MEGFAELDLGSGFFHKGARTARDFSVLLARQQFVAKKYSRKTLRWLDLMSGCGIRALRWGLESTGLGLNERLTKRHIEIWVNDADPQRSILIEKNMKPITLKRDNISLNLNTDCALRVLGKAFLDNHFFDFIDIDCFGCPNDLLYLAFKILEPEGTLLLTSTDARSLTGHDRFRAIRRLSASSRTNPSSWEIALRLQIGAMARQAWLLGRGFEPIASFCNGKTFRIAVRLKKRIQICEELNLGFWARCEYCGSQACQSLLRLKGWAACDCETSKGRWDTTGPLWMGALQKHSELKNLLGLTDSLCSSIDPSTKKLLLRLLDDEGKPFFCWSTHELASRLNLKGPPRLSKLIESLLDAGFEAKRSALMDGQVRTDAPLKDLLKICGEIGPGGT